MDSFKLLKQKIERASNEELANIISDFALRLNREQTDTVLFIFWLSFMTEKDLDQALCESWKLAKEYGPSGEEVISIIKDNIDITKIDIDDSDYASISVYFGDKIKIYEQMFGTNTHVKLFRKIKNLRNDISHGRIDDLKYEDLDLKTKEGKQKILIDYFEIMTKKDSGEPLAFKHMSESEKKEVKKVFNQWKEDNNHD